MRFKLWLETQHEAILFYQRDREQYGFLSNFHPSPIVIDGIHYNTVEHFYQSMKSEDQNYRNSVMSAPTPGKAKRLGTPGHKQSSLTQLPPDWETRKFEIMNKGVLAKFTQNPDLKAALKNTRSSQLLEDSPTDLVFGTGPIDEQGQFPGKNMLGVILMDVRNRL
jgi:N-glycosidase YbiA